MKRGSVASILVLALPVLLTGCLFTYTEKTTTKVLPEGQTLERTEQIRFREMAEPIPDSAGLIVASPEAARLRGATFVLDGVGFALNQLQLKEAFPKKPEEKEEPEVLRKLREAIQKSEQLTHGEKGQITTQLAEATFMTPEYFTAFRNFFLQRHGAGRVDLILAFEVDRTKLPDPAAEQIPIVLAVVFKRPVETTFIVAGQLDDQRGRFVPDTVRVIRLPLKPSATGE